MARGALKPVRYRPRIPLVEMLRDGINATGAVGVVVSLHTATNGSAPVKAPIRSLPEAGADWRVKAETGPNAT